MHRKTVAQFNDNLRTQYIAAKGYQGIRTVKTFKFKNTRSNFKKNIAIAEKKVKQNVRQINIPIRDIYLQALILVLALQMN